MSSRPRLFALVTLLVLTLIGAFLYQRSPARGVVVERAHRTAAQNVLVGSPGTELEFAL